MTNKLFWLADHWGLYSSAVAQDFFVLEGALAGGYVMLAATAVSSLRRQGVSSKELKSFMSKRNDEVISRDELHGEVARV